MHLRTGNSSSTSQRATPKRDPWCRRGRRPSCCRAAPALPHGPGRQQRWERGGQATSAPRPRSQLPPRPSLPAVLSRTAAAAQTFWEPEPPWGGGGEGPGGEGGTGAEFQSPAVRPRPAGSVAQSLMQRGCGSARRGSEGRTVAHSPPTPARNRCFSFSAASSPQRLPQSALA